MLWWVLDILISYNSHDNSAVDTAIIIVLWWKGDVERLSALPQITQEMRIIWLHSCVPIPCHTTSVVLDVRNTKYLLSEEWVIKNFPFKLKHKFWSFTPAWMHCRSLGPLSSLVSLPTLPLPTGAQFPRCCYKYTPLSVTTCLNETSGASSSVLVIVLKLGQGNSGFSGCMPDSTSSYPAG